MSEDRFQIAPQRGFTLVEMMVVVALLALIAAIAVPSASSSFERSKLELAGAQVADALRFAREESRRTGNMYGVTAEISTNRVRVFRLDRNPDPNLKVFDVYQPVAKQLYNVVFDSGSRRGVALSAVGGDMVGTCDDAESFAFDAMGVVRCSEDTETRIRDAFVDLSIGRLRSRVAIDSYTGRVSIR